MVLSDKTAIFFLLIHKELSISVTHLATREGINSFIYLPIYFRNGKRERERASVEERE